VTAQASREPDRHEGDLSLRRHRRCRVAGQPGRARARQSLLPRQPVESARAGRPLLVPVHALASRRSERRFEAQRAFRQCGGR
jgi:hypothetical protein